MSAVVAGGSAEQEANEDEKGEVRVARRVDVSIVGVSPSEGEDGLEEEVGVSGRAVRGNSMAALNAGTDLVV